MIAVQALERLDAAARTRLLDRPSPLDDAARSAAIRILARVRAEGDAALFALTRELDGVALEALSVPRRDCFRALDGLSDELKRALGTAKRNLERFHEPQRLDGYELAPEPGVTLGQRAVAYERVGIYVPKNLPSSLLMAAVPARLAGVCELVACTPPDAHGRVPETVRAAAALVDLDGLHPIGGAQAIAALAHGTGSVRPVEKIVGPGNAYVTAAKALVHGFVGIEALAGPSEVALVVEPVEGLDSDRLADWALAELRAQLEHGPGTSALLLTSLPDLAAHVAEALSHEVDASQHVALLSYGSLDEALRFVNDYAPEHLCLWGPGPEGAFSRIKAAGSVFLGPWTPVALGDYASGTNHILPTARGARLGGGLTVRDFQRTISYQRVTRDGLVALAPAVTTLAEAEGMRAHARSVRTRLEESQ